MKSLKSIFVLLTTCLLFYPIQAQRYKTMIESGEYTVEEIVEEAESYFAEKDKGRGSGYKQWKRWEYDAKRMFRADGKLKTDKELYREILRYQSQINHTYSTREPDCMGAWRSLGPDTIRVTSGYNPGVGRITSIGIDKNDSLHFIVGSQTGGVWKTEDGGTTWTSLTDEFVNLDVYSLAIAPSNPNIYYWGSTNGMIFRSSDRGATWDMVVDEDEGRIVRILVHKSDENRFWYAIPYVGLGYATHGGDSTNLLLTNSIYDLEFHPTDSSIVYASGYNFYKSTDSGESFERMDDGVFSFGVKMMAVTPAAPSSLYMIEEDGAGGFTGFYISEDEGENFIKNDSISINLFGYSLDGSEGGGQAPRDMDIAVSETDSNLIYIAGINLYRTKNKMSEMDIVTHWYYPNTKDYNLGYCHADIDIMAMNGGQLLIGSDGGIFRVNDIESEIDTQAVQDLSRGLSVHQFYRIGVAQSNEEIITGGAQDNGSNIFVDGEWRHFYGADGMEGFVTDGDTMAIFGTSQFGGLVRSLDTGLSLSFAFFSGIEDAIGEGKWVTPFEKSTANNNTIFVGFDRIYRSDDLGDFFYPISQEFSAEEYDHVDEFKVARNRNDIIYMSNSYGELYRSNGSTLNEWTRVFRLSDFAESINCIAIHPRNPDLVALAIRGKRKVLVSHDGGQNFEKYAEGLPDFSALCLTWQNDDDETLYLGMNYGIYKRSKGEDEWAPFSQGLPNVRVNELEINEVTGMIYAGTYGRGLWVSPICPTMGSAVNNLNEFNISLSPNPVKANNTLTLTASKPLDVDIRIFNAVGQVVYRKTDISIFDKHHIHWKSHPAGQYTMRLSNAEGIKIISFISQ